MRPAAFFVSLFVFLCPAFGHAAGTAATDNFNVIAPTEAIAQAVAKQAEQFRRQAALEWLGRELPSGKGPAMITVIISADEDDGLTWPIDTPQRKFHQVWLTTSAERAVARRCITRSCIRSSTRVRTPTSFPLGQTRELPARSTMPSARNRGGGSPPVGRTTATGLNFRRCSVLRGSAIRIARAMPRRPPWRNSWQAAAGRPRSSNLPGPVKRAVGPGRPRLLRRPRRGRTPSPVADVGQLRERTHGELEAGARFVQRICAAGAMMTSCV